MPGTAENAVPHGEPAAPGRRDREPGETVRRYHPSELPPHLMAAIMDARMDPAHGHLDELMADDKGCNAAPMT